MIFSKQSGAVPYHIAVIMDGNGRWAKRRLLPRLAGHKQGVAALRKCAQACMDRGVKVLTVFAFSSENWSRPQEEVSGLMSLFVSALARELSELHRDGVRLRFVGDRSALGDRSAQGETLMSSLLEAEELTARNEEFLLNVCFNYGGRWDIAQAAQKVVEQGLPMTAENLDKFTALGDVPDPDLLIRTGGEMRISNFLLWQVAYSEMFFSASLWPEFDEKELDAAIAAFGGRERRFGQTSEQVQQAETSSSIES